jgi:hypothetical protein
MIIHFEYMLHCADLDTPLLCDVEANVKERGLFGPGQGYLDTEIERVIVHLTNKAGEVVFHWDATHDIEAATQGHIRDVAEQKYNAQKTLKERSCDDWEREPA